MHLCNTTQALGWNRLFLSNLDLGYKSATNVLPHFSIIGQLTQAQTINFNFFGNLWYAYGLWDKSVYVAVRSQGNFLSLGNERHQWEMQLYYVRKSMMMVTVITTIQQHSFKY